MGLKSPRLIFLILAVVLVTTAVVLAVSGGFRTTVGGFRVSVRSPLATSIAALIAGAWWWYLARRERSVATDLEIVWQALERHSSRLIGVVALTAAIIAAAFATRSAAGADASGYLSQAAAFTSSDSFPPRYIERIRMDFLELKDITTPLGWRISGALCDLNCDIVQVPTYPPGLPLLMAIPHELAGINGANGVVIVSAAVAVWVTGVMVGGMAGVMASVLLALSPVFIFQSLQPMSDVPVTAAWMLCFFLLSRGKADGLAGAACGVAVLIRPNLAPLAIVPLLIAGRKIVFATPVVAAGLFLGVVQMSWYGSPLQSGYGAANELFTLANIAPNVQRYSTWLIATAPVMLLAPLGFMRVRNGRQSRALAVFSLLVIAAYLIYGVFDNWSYLRFLLPALAVFAMLAAIELWTWIERLPISWRPPIVFCLILVVTAHSVIVARSLDTFQLADQVRRVEQVANFINEQKEAGAVVLSGEQSGSVRYYTGRPILRWEAATAEQLSAAVAVLEQHRRPVYVVLDAWENEPFQKKFAAVPSLALDWPAAVEAGTTHRTRLWRVGDRARFLAGENLSTIRLP